ncbi:MAG: RHS repeat-associated core domain-containing protein [Chitinophagales bacterium]
MQSVVNKLKSTPKRYYPFGMVMPGRTWEAAGGYRYGFNGKEKDDEIEGNGNALDFGARVYDSRIGRWFSVDPLCSKYPSSSPFSYALNNPVLFTDGGGRDAEITIQGNKITVTSTTFLTGYGAEISMKQFNEAFNEWSEAGKNKSTFKDASGKEYEIEIIMVFKVANDEDVERIKSAGAGANGENLMEFKGNVRSHADIIDRHIIENGSYVIKGGRRYASMNDYADGWEAIHEGLHFIGLIDRYSDVTYEKYSEDGTFLGVTDKESTPHVGYETNAMGTLNQNLENMNLNDTQWSNLGTAILESSKNASNETNFVYSEDNIEQEDSSVAKEYVADDITYTNPK